MGLFDKLVGNGSAGGQAQPSGQTGTQPQITPEMRQDIVNIKNNPAAFLRQQGLNIPDNMTDPRQIAVYLLRSGQINAARPRQLFGGMK